MLCLLQVNAQTVTVKAGTKLVTTGNVSIVVKGSGLNLAAGSGLSISNGSLSLNSALAGAGALASLANTNDLILNYSSANGSIGTLNFQAGNNTLRSLRLNLSGTNSPAITLGSSVTVATNLTFTNGLVILNGNDLTISSTATVSGGNSNSYAVLDGTSRMIQQNIGTGGRTGTVIYPIGFGVGSYTPIALANTGTADDFSVGLLDNVYATYSGETPTSAPLTSGAVDRTWLISEATPGGSNATLSVQWNLADELTGFTRNNCFISHYTGTAWAADAPGAAFGSNPYARTMTGITSFSPFGVGSAAPLPVDLVSFAGKSQGANAMLNWVTANEKDIATFQLERSVDARDFSAITIVNAKNAGTVQQQYSYLDATVSELNANTVYYRLKIVDKNGTSQYSQVISIAIATEGKAFVTLFPNPVSGTTLFLNTNGTIKNMATVQVMDMIGKVMTTANISAADFQSGKTTINISALAPGTYLMHVTDDENKLNQAMSFTKQ